MKKNIEKIVEFLSENNKKEDVLSYYEGQRKDYNGAASYISNELAINDTIIKFSYPAAIKAINAWNEIVSNEDIIPTDFYLEKCKKYIEEGKKNPFEHALVKMMLYYKIYGKK